MSKLLIIFVFVLTLFFLASIYFVSDNLTSDFRSTYTSAVCNGKICQDYEFTCENGVIVNSLPISGFVSFENWTDIRENKNRC
jgi:hypothetical protein